MRTSFKTLPAENSLPTWRSDYLRSLQWNQGQFRQTHTAVPHCPRPSPDSTANLSRLKILKRRGGRGVPTLPAALLLLTSLAASGQTIARAQLEQWREQAVHALSIDSPLPPVAAHSFGSQPAAPGVHIEHVTFATQFGRRVPAIVYVPDHPRTHLPAIVVVDGHGGDKSSWYAVYTGLLYASAGAVVVTYDPVGEFERSTSRGSEVGEHDKPIPGLTHPERVGGLMIEDALQALRYAAARPDVDRNRIAMVGYSMGSFHAGLAAALASKQVPRIRALVLSGGGNLDGNGGAWDTSANINCQGAPYRALSFMPDKGADLYAMRSQAGPTLVMNGYLDHVVSNEHEFEPFFEDLRARVAALTGSTNNLPQSVWLPEVGHRPSFMTRPAAIFLEYQLHFPNWTPEQIEQLSTIKAADWVKRTGVRISKGYIVDVKEGGIPILDLNLPGLTRDQLTAVPRARWDKDPSTYTLAGWIPFALKADQAKD